MTQKNNKYCPPPAFQCFEWTLSMQRRMRKQSIQFQLFSGRPHTSLCSTLVCLVAYVGKIISCHAFPQEPATTTACLDQHGLLVTFVEKGFYHEKLPTFHINTQYGQLVTFVEVGFQYQKQSPKLSTDFAIVILLACVQSFILHLIPHVHSN